jgi:heterodisulfide reductase subunit B
MQTNAMTDLTYYPGCSLATTSKENNSSLIHLFKHLGYNLVELEDWNCCGSSSAHSVDSDLALDLACRNLSLAPPDRPLLVACPSCLLRLRGAFLHVKEDESMRRHYEQTWGKPFDANLEILHFFEFLDKIDLLGYTPDRVKQIRSLLRMHAGTTADHAA